MDWLLVMWVVNGFDNSIDQHVISLRTNTQVACEKVLETARRNSFKGLCVYDPVQ